MGRLLMMGREQGSKQLDNETEVLGPNDGGCWGPDSLTAKYIGGGRGVSTANCRKSRPCATDTPTRKKNKHTAPRRVPGHRSHVPADYPIHIDVYANLLSGSGSGGFGRSVWRRWRQSRTGCSPLCWLGISSGLDQVSRQCTTLAPLPTCA